MPAELNFTSLVGQNQAKAFLNRVFASERLAHAYLFRGPDGVGKKYCAGLAAARLNCAQPSPAGGCGNCSSCRKFLSGNHPDILVISPESGSIKIDRVRELCRSLSYPPYESKMRVMILEDVHTMGPAAANSLLKTLEEPPPGNLLILTAESSAQVLPTIVSRCQIVAFYPLTDDQAARVIVQQRPEIEDAEARLLANLAGGSPGAALRFHKQELVAAYRSVAGLLGDGSVELAEGGAAGGEVAKVLAEAEQLAALKDELPLLLGLLRMWVRDRMVASPGDDPSVSLRQRMRLEALDLAERQLARNCNRTLVCEVLLFNLQSPEPRVSL